MNAWFESVRTINIRSWWNNYLINLFNYSSFHQAIKSNVVILCGIKVGFRSHEKRYKLIYIRIRTEDKWCNHSSDRIFRTGCGTIKTNLPYLSFVYLNCSTLAYSLCVLFCHSLYMRKRNFSVHSCSVWKIKWELDNWDDICLRLINERERANHDINNFN